MIGNSNVGGGDKERKPYAKKQELKQGERYKFKNDGYVLLQFKGSDSEQAVDVELEDVDGKHLGTVNFARTGWGWNTRPIYMRRNMRVVVSKIKNGGTVTVVD